jgi:hypothetical protein
MRAGRKRTLLSWTTYTKGEVEHAGDAREGLWSHAQLEAMDQKFCRAVERAFAGRVELIVIPDASVLPLDPGSSRIRHFDRPVETAVSSSSKD